MSWGFGEVAPARGSPGRGEPAMSRALNSTLHDDTQNGRTGSVDWWTDGRTAGEACNHVGKVVLCGLK